MSNLSQSVCQESCTKKCRLRFTHNDDLALLREFVGQNPLANPNGWEVMRQNLQICTGKAFTIRTIKQHLILIIELWIKKDEVDKVRSGIEDAYSERDNLLQEASALCREFKFVGLEKQKKKTPRDVQLLQLGKKARDSYLGHLQTTNNEMNLINENASTSSGNKGTPECKLASWKVCNQNNDVCFKETSIDDQENAIFVSSEHDYVNCVDIEQEPSSSKSNYKDTLEIDMDTLNKTSSEVITPKKNQGWLELNVDNVPSSDITPKLKNIYTEQNRGVSVPLRKRTRREPIRKNALNYLTEKNEKEFAVRKKELELEERKIAIEERRISLDEEKVKLENRRLDIECQERMQRIESEKKEKEITYKILQKMMDTLADKCNKA